MSNTCDITLTIFSEVKINFNLENYGIFDYIIDEEEDDYTRIYGFAHWHIPYEDMLRLAQDIKADVQVVGSTQESIDLYEISDGEVVTNSSMEMKLLL